MRDCAAHNRIYRVVWNRARNVWMVVGEIAKGLGKGNGRRKHSLRGLLLLIPLSLISPLAMAAPTGGQVTAGSGTISQSGSTTTIHQSSQNLSLSWKSFNVGSSETVNFNQPNSSAVAVNRIYDTQGSTILGHINANGNIYLINPNGILFGASAQVNVGGLVASTLDTPDSTLSSNTRTFSGSGTGAVVNEGTINASHYVALLGNSVTNSGVITAQMGTVAMGAGNQVSLTFSGNQLVKLHVDQSVVDTLVANHGLVEANGGMVIMNAGARDSLLASVVNNDGIVEAQTVNDHNGTISLLGGMVSGTVNVGGTLDASAPNGGNGGSIETSAHNVKIASGATVTAAAVSGLAGSWLIDPVDLTINGAAATAIDTALNAGTSVTEETTATGTSNSGSTNAGTTATGLGDINVDAAISWNGTGSTLTLSAYHSININAPITASGSNDGLVLTTDNNVGGTSSGGTLNVNAPVTFSGTTPNLTIDGIAYTIITTLGTSNGSVTGTDLQGINYNTTSSGHYALGMDINATPTSTNSTSWNGGFTPIANTSGSFGGVFEGLGHTITGLTINSSGGYVGMFRELSSTGVVRDVGLVDASITGKWNVGALVGNSYGTISNVYATGSVTGTNNNVGGLVGENFGNISYAYATGKVTGAKYVGGLVGQNYNSGTQGPHNDATIYYSYATGDVTGNTNVGGLVGEQSLAATTISDCYATGKVTASHDGGGLVGYWEAGAMGDSYWDTTTSGMQKGIGVGKFSTNNSNANIDVGLTTTQLAAALPSSTSLSFSSSIWADAGGQTTPYLLANAGFSTVSGHVILGTDTSTTPTYYDVIQTMTQLQDINSTGLAGNYVLGTNLTDTTTTGSGFTPIGTGTSFTGVFDGLNHTITGLYINNNASTNGVGMFAKLDGGAVVRNIGLVNVDVNGNSKDWVGGLVGVNTNGTISNAYVTGTVKDSTNGDVGGLVGTNHGTITDSYAAATVNGPVAIGGLVGHNASTGKISNSYATGTVSNASATDVGGLVGYNYGSISNAYATGTVKGKYNVGGLVGVAYSATGSTIKNAYATGAVTGTTNVGGLVGDNSKGSISNAYATGTVTQNAGGSVIGGLVGLNSSNGTISNAYATGNITGTNTVGGLVGSGSGTVKYGYWDGTTDINAAASNGIGTKKSTTQLASALPTGFSSSVWADGSNGNGGQTTPYLLANASFSTVGGHVILGTDGSVAAPTYYDVIQTMTQLQDINTTGVNGHYALGNNLDATATSGWNGGAGFAPIGGGSNAFMGVFDGLSHYITNLSIDRPSTSYVGLFGASYGIVRNVGLVGGSVTGSSYVGGLVGYSAVYGVSNVFATDSVNGSNNVGGLVGYNEGSISNAYATGTVTGSNYVGGLVGENFTGDFHGSITDAYAAGKVIPKTGGISFGGLVGSNAGSTITNSYWDTGTMGVANGIGIDVGGTTTGSAGLSDSAMKQQASFTPQGTAAGDWNFPNTWYQYDGYTYPLLRSFMRPMTVTANSVVKAYDGTPFSGGGGVGYSLSPGGHVFGTVGYTGSSQGAVNAGAYIITPADLFSDQEGFVITFANGNLVIVGGGTSADSNSDTYVLSLLKFFLLHDPFGTLLGGSGSLFVVHGGVNVPAGASSSLADFITEHFGSSFLLKALGSAVNEPAGSI